MEIRNFKQVVVLKARRDLFFNVPRSVTEIKEQPQGGCA
jgi:hypothetical protein